MLVRAVVHVHSEWSYDGAWTLEKIANLFRRLNCKVILMSEHDISFDHTRWESYQKACAKLSDEGLLIIPGIEYSDENNAIHVLTWAVAEFLGNNQPTGNILEKVNEKNGICVFAHPSRHEAWQRLDSSWLPLFHGIEFWNRKFDGIAPSREASDLLKLSGKSTPFVGLDFHRINQLFPLSMMIHVKGTLSKDNVFTALRTGQSYPLAMGVSALRFTDGFLSSSVKVADRIRRLASKLIKP